jgi:aspartate kinase
VHDWPMLKAALQAEVPGLTVEDEALGAVSVVGTGLAADHRVLRAVLDVLGAAGAPPRAVFTSALRVTAYCESRLVKDAVKELHRQLIG